jgi:sugar phosphate permease
MPAKSLTREKWYRLIPIVFITYSFAYLDRANFAFAAAGGMEADLNISKEMLSLLGSLFFLGYFLFQIPGAMYAEKRSVKTLIFWSLILWGGLAVATGLVNDVHILILIRFMLGLVESAVMPALLILLSTWFTKKERSRANTFLILGNPTTVLWMSILSGYLVQATGWRGMFIIEGIPAILWAFVWWKRIDDKPEKAEWLHESGKQQIEKQLLLEQGQIKPVKNYAAAFRSPAVILLSLQFFLWCVGEYGFVMWLPSIIKAAPRMGIVETGWLSAVPYMFAIFGMLIASYFSDKTLNRSLFIWPFLLTGAIAFYASYLVGVQNFWLSYALLVVAGSCMFAPFGPFFAAITDVLPQNVAGGAIALINSLGAAGAFVGSYMVGYLSGTSGSFGSSFLIMSGALLLSSFFTVIAIKDRQYARNPKHNTAYAMEHEL